jgi:hypothetical protein
MSKILCSCSACKNVHPGGKFLHPSTVWRHRKKEQNLDINSSDIFSAHEEVSTMNSSNYYDSGFIFANAPVIDNLKRYILLLLFNLNLI